MFSDGVFWMGVYYYVEAQRLYQDIRSMLICIFLTFRRFWQDGAGGRCKATNHVK